MKKISYWLVVVIAIAGCKKDNNIAPAPKPGVIKKLVRIETAGYPESTVDFTYDPDGRLITSETPEYKETLTYHPNTVDYVKYSKTENRIYSSGSFILNNDGYATGIDLTVHPTANTTKLYQYTYEYTPDGYISKRSYTLNGVNAFVSQEYIGGDMSVETYVTNGTMNSSWKYTYSAAEDKTGINTRFTTYANGIGGKLTKHLWTKSEQFSPANVKMNEAQCTNELDADGYLVKRSVHYTADNTDYHYTYTYDK